MKLGKKKKPGFQNPQNPLQTLPHALKTSIYYPLFNSYQTFLLLKQERLKSDDKSISAISSSQFKNLSYWITVGQSRLKCKTKCLSPFLSEGQNPQKYCSERGKFCYSSFFLVFVYACMCMAWGMGVSSFFFQENDYGYFKQYPVYSEGDQPSRLFCLQG